MDAALLRCLSFLILLSIISGSSALVNKRAQRHSNPQGQMVFESYEAITTTMHDAYPTIVGSPGDIPTLDPSPTTPTTTPSTMPLTPMTGPPTMPTTGPPTTPTTTPMPPYGGAGVIGGGGGGGGDGGGGGSWCVANPGASEKALQVGLDYACGYGGADCSQIQTGASCFNPDTIRDHASYAYNDYYQKNPAPTSCDFGGTAQLVNSDPSSGSCNFPSKGSASPTPTTPTPMMQTPPVLSPPSPSSTLLPGIPPGGGSGFGPEPTASPNIATTTHQQFLLFSSSTSILIYILLANPV